MRSRLTIALFTLLCLVAGAGAADTLEEAKRAGIVGEQANGYLGVVDARGTPAARALVNDINDQRRERYRAIAERNGIELEAVELLAGRKAIEKTPAGQFIRPASGPWRPK